MNNEDYITAGFAVLFMRKYYSFFDILGDIQERLSYARALVLLCLSTFTLLCVVHLYDPYCEELETVFLRL